jgi:hypothetical protein
MRGALSALLLVSIVVRAVSDEDSETETIETVERLEANDTTRLATAFFSGEPWLIYCEKQLSSESIQFAKFRKASKRLRSVNFGVLDCSAKLPSGKSTIGKFKLDGKKKPVLLLCANGEKPLQLSKGDYSSKKGSTTINVTTLVDSVRTKMKPRVYAVTQRSTLRKRCFSKRACGIVLHQRQISGVDGRIVHELMMMHRNVSFVTIDTSQHKFSLESKLPPVKVEGSKKQKKTSLRFVFFKPWQNISGTEMVKAKYIIPYGRGVEDSDDKQHEPVVLSLSGRQLRSSDNLTVTEADAFFDKHVVSYAKLMETGPQLMSHPNLLAEIDGQRYPWSVAKHEFASGLFFQKSLGSSFLSKEVTRQVKQELKGDQEGGAKDSKKQKSKAEKKMAAKAHVGSFSIASMDEFLKEAAKVCGSLGATPSCALFTRTNTCPNRDSLRWYR